ncbi:MAG: DUF1385 domain-containing protein [Ruminococcaceae bacterium]|nr:DUF1385 domain-containing protein [Oscillospiraceae bacterium]
MSKQAEKNCRLGTVGGQAVLEGIMMKGKEEYAIAVRREDGTVSLTKQRFTSIRSKHKILRLPILRGIVGFVESMVLNFKTLSISAEQYGLEEAEPETKFEKWLTNTFGEKLMSVIMGISMFLGIALAIGLFFLLPSYIAKGIEWLAGRSLGIFMNLIEGVIKIIIFVAYLMLVSLMKDIRRTFEYHGAEHKSIFCYESGEELTVENVKKHRRFHPRCGTSFIFVILIISILVNSLPFVTWDNMLLRMLTKILILPLIVGIGFEFIMFAGKHDNFLTRILSAPGLFMQRITTREPDDSQIEIAIIALKTALPDVFPDYRYEDPHDAVSDENSETETESASEPESCSQAASEPSVSADTDKASE